MLLSVRLVSAVRRHNRQAVTIDVIVSDNIYSSAINSIFALVYQSNYLQVENICTFTLARALNLLYLYDKKITNERATTIKFRRFKTSFFCFPLYILTFVCYAPHFVPCRRRYAPQVFHCRRRTFLIRFAESSVGSAICSLP